MPDLFDPFDLHGLKLPNRIVMSAMTRTRATEDDVPTDVMRDYYVQRASAGLIITECIDLNSSARRDLATRSVTWSRWSPRTSRRKRWPAAGIS
jgi:2,4-dienoyl-CoA reductase-like NADH-dependent reductase (Old Yellow Enzyme family)